MDWQKRIEELRKQVGYEIKYQYKEHIEEAIWYPAFQAPRDAPRLGGVVQTPF